MTKKKTKEKKKVKLLWARYEKKNNTFVIPNKSCPKCGAGFFMAKHKERDYCGNCRYTEFKTKKKEK